MSSDFSDEQAEELGSERPVSNVLYYVIPVLLILAYAAVRRRLRNRYWIFRDALVDHPIDFVRRRLTRGLRVSTGAQELRRGDEVETLVTISRPSGLGDVEVGLVCTEYYDYQETWTDKDGTHTSRETADATAYEAWQPLESAQGPRAFAWRFRRMRRSRTKASASPSNRTS